MRLDRYKDRNPNLEPLYTLPEIADKLRMEYKTLRAKLINRHNKLPTPKIAMKVGASFSVGGVRNLYKLSEFKAWIKTLEN